MRELLDRLLRNCDRLAQLAVDVGEDAIPLEELEEEVDDQWGIVAELLRAGTWIQRCTNGLCR